MERLIVVRVEEGGERFRVVMGVGGVVVED